MKKIVFFILLMVIFTGARAQKFAYVDTQYILDNLPEYTEAQAQLDEVSQQWQKEVEQKFQDVNKMKQEYLAQQVLFPEDMKKKKEKDIDDLDKEARNLQRQRFGKDGDLMKKRQELVKPIQEKIYNAIQDVATNNNYSIIFDKAGALTIMYANPKYDVSDEVLDNLGAVSTGRKSKSGSGSTGGGGIRSGSGSGDQGGSKEEKK
ncbi:MAG: OmpH family outer membrane protein [Syntrophothermus sp.]